MESLFQRQDDAKAPLHHLNRPRDFFSSCQDLGVYDSLADELWAQNENKLLLSPAIMQKPFLPSAAQETSESRLR